jgi:uncharacterized protein
VNDFEQYEHGSEERQDYALQPPAAELQARERPSAEPSPPEPPPTAELFTGEPPAAEPQTPEPMPPRPPRDPFWGYNDLLIFLGIAPVALLLGAFTVNLFFRLLRIHPAAQVVELLPEQFAGYVLLFGGLAALFRIWYGRPFWRSLGWRALRLPFSLVMVAGVATAVLVAFGGAAIHMGDQPNPMTDLMKGRTALILMAIFGVTAAPIAEELVFRGFLQPLLVRSLGPALGILLQAIPFGLLHFQEYGNSWAHAILICLAGAAFGWMRYATGSTKASALMHASYNALFFAAAFSAGKDLPH